jgi:tripartite-type tricarboxylate transporter receptor subunit TctC
VALSNHLPVRHRLALALILMTPVFASAADVFPSKPVRLIVPFSAGGGTDITARALAQKLGDRWGHQVVVDNRPGAAGDIGAEIVAHAAPDGYTLLAITATHTVSAALRTKMSYDLVRDLTPLSQVTSLPYMLVVHPASPAKTVRELIALSKGKPGGLTYGSSGIGSLAHLAGAMLANASGTQFLYVPYKGSAPAVADVMGGQLDMAFPSILQTTQVRSGRLRAIAVTSLKRSAALPEVPTISESIPGYEINQWNGMLAPPGLSAALAARLSSDINDVLAMPEVKTRLGADGSEAVGTTPQAFGKLLRDEIAKWKKLSKDAGLKID